MTLPYNIDSMEALNKKGDDLNPDVSFNPDTGQFSLKGKSIPLNVNSFFTDIIQWLETYEKSPSDDTNFEIDLKYLNGQSIRTLLTILTSLKTINDSGRKVNVEWTIPDGAEDMMDLSEELLSNLKLPHHIKHN